MSQTIDNTGSIKQANRITDVFLALKAIINLIQRPTWISPTSGRVKVDNTDTFIISGNIALATASATVTVQGSLTTLTNLAQLGGFDAKQTLLFSNERTSWSLNVRGRIT